MKKLLTILLAISILFMISCDKTTKSDDTPPTVVITYPANNSEFAEGEVITITADANDNKGIEKVEFYIDGTKVSTDTTEPYEYEWDTGSGKNVNHTIYTKAFDTSDNSTNSEAITVIITENTVTDIDGNVYQTIIIGDQEWMMENLKVTHYRNGDAIPTGYSNNEWANLSSGAYCVYGNNPSNADTYGNLYNWYAVDDSRGLAPEGWHVPTDDDWKELEMYLGMTQVQADYTGYRGTNEGSKLAGRADLWEDNGDLENNSEFGSSGFTALPSGYRLYDYGYFYNIGYCAIFWSSSDTNGGKAWYRSLDYYSSAVDRNYLDKKDGFSMRCLRD